MFLQFLLYMFIYLFTYTQILYSQQNKYDCAYANRRALQNKQTSKQTAMRPKAQAHEPYPHTGIYIGSRVMVLEKRQSHISVVYICKQIYVLCVYIFFFWKRKWSQYRSFFFEPPRVKLPLRYYLRKSLLKSGCQCCKTALLMTNLKQTGQNVSCNSGASRSTNF